MADMNAAALDAIAGAVNAVARDPAVPGLTSTTAPAVAKAITDELGPVLVNATNNEPWWKSRVLLGSIGAIVTSGISLWGLAAAGVSDGQLYAPPIAAILGSSFAIYGRIIAQKPIGS